MLCALCGTRKARRDCPALHTSICSICCGTKRLTEIRCPSTCVHLAAARQHPPAAVRRQQERDVAMLLPTIRHLTEQQQQCFFLLCTVIVLHRPDDFGVVRLEDADVADAAGSLAGTLETAARGVIYEHTPGSPSAQRLARDFQAVLEETRQRATLRDTDAATALRAIEEGARRARADTGSDTGYIEVMRRVMQASTSAAKTPTVVAPPSLIIPGT